MKIWNISFEISLLIENIFIILLQLMLRSSKYHQNVYIYIYKLGALNWNPVNACNFALDIRECYLTVYMAAPSMLTWITLKRAIHSKRYLAEHNNAVKALCLKNNFPRFMKEIKLKIIRLIKKDKDIKSTIYLLTEIKMR